MIKIEKGIIGITKDRTLIVFESEQEFTEHDKDNLASFYAGLNHLIDHLDEK